MAKEYRQNANYGEIINEDEEKGKGGGGNKNALAYGLLAGAHVNTEGMSPSEAWAMVDELHLMDRKQKKKTEEEKEDYKNKNDIAKKEGKTKKTAINNAGKISSHVALHSDNVAGLNESVNTAMEIMSEYNLTKLKTLQTSPHIGSRLFTALACANGESLTISRDLLKNPGAFYRSSVANYKADTKAEIERLEKIIPTIKSEKIKLRTEEELKNKKDDLGYTRHNVMYKGEEIKCTILHEMGHVIADQLCGQINGSRFLKSNVTSKDAKQKRELIEQTYIECVGNGSIYKISEYGGTNEHEFFAEAFAMYKMGKEKLPENIEKMIEGVLK